MFAELFCSSSMMGVLGAGGLLACGACFPAPPKGLNPGAVISTDWAFFFNHDRLDTDIAAICDGVFSRVRIGNQDIRLAGPRPASAPPLEQAEPLNDSRLGRACGSAGGGCGERCEPRSGECAPLGGAGRRWHCAPAAARGLRSA